MDVEKMFESRFIKASDFNGKPWTLKISGARLEEVFGIKGKQKKGCIEFEGATKAWIINRTNAILCVAMFGRDTDRWTGKRVTLHPVVWNGEDLAIRVMGSPDIEKDTDVEVKLPGRNPIRMTMKKTPEPARNAKQTAEVAP